MTTTYATHLGPEAASDPTAVMGRRILGWFLDGLVYLALMFGVLALVGEYKDVDEGFDGDNVEFCEDLLDANRDFSGNCIAPPFGDRVYLVEGSDSLLQSGVGFGWFIVNFVLLQGLVGASVGKLLTGLRVVNVQGARAGVGRCLVRSLAWIIDGLPGVPLVGGIAAVTSNGHRRVGDMIAGTRVVGAKSVGAPVDVPAAPVPAGAQAWGAPPQPGPPTAPPQPWGTRPSGPPAAAPQPWDQPAPPPPGTAEPASEPSWASPGAPDQPDPTSVSPAFDPTQSDLPVTPPPTEPPPSEPPPMEPPTDEPRADEHAEGLVTEGPVDDTAEATGPPPPSASDSPVPLPPPFPTDEPGEPPAGEMTGPVEDAPTADEAEASMATEDDAVSAAAEPLADTGAMDAPSDDPADPSFDPSATVVGATPPWEPPTPASPPTVESEAAAETASEPEPEPQPEAEPQSEAPTPPSTPLPDPQWDQARNTYIQWDPNQNAWLQWDTTAETWKPIDT